MRTHKEKAQNWVDLINEMWNDFDGYSELAAFTDKTKGDYNVHLSGLAAELGEVAALINKYIRDQKEIDKDKMRDELGDVLWQLDRLANDFELSLSEIAARNIEKLADRYERNVISGSGDNR